MHIRINTTSGAYSLTVNPNDTVSTVLARIEGVILNSTLQQINIKYTNYYL